MSVDDDFIDRILEGTVSDEEAMDFARRLALEEGILADVAPTLLKVMGIEQPSEMTGKVLIS